jgi:hypothetical protein
MSDDNEPRRIFGYYNKKDESYWDHENENSNASFCIITTQHYEDISCINNVLNIIKDIVTKRVHSLKYETTIVMYFDTHLKSHIYEYIKTKIPNNSMFDTLKIKYCYPRFDKISNKILSKKLNYNGENIRCRAYEDALTAMIANSEYVYVFGLQTPPNEDANIVTKNNYNIINTLCKYSPCDIRYAD